MRVDQDVEKTRRAKLGEVRAWLQALQTLFDDSPVAVGFFREGIMLDANAAYVELFGFSNASELPGTTFIDRIAPSQRMEHNVAHHAAGRALRSQLRGVRKNGTEFPFEITTTHVTSADGPLTIAFIFDVTEREEANDALRASEERFRTLSDAAFEGVMLHGDGIIVLANEIVARMYGYEPASIIGVSLLDLTAPESRHVVADHMRRASNEAYEVLARRRDGSTFFAEIRGRTMSRQGRSARVAVIRDISERKRVEAEQRALEIRVRDTQKLESLMVLAAGAAHDFNNILSVIMNETALARRRPDLARETAAHLDGIMEASERAADLCRQMLAYAGKAELARNTVDLSALVGGMSSMLDVSSAKKAKLVWELAPNLPKLKADASQLRQIVMNLVINASEAIDRPDGMIVVSTGSGTYRAEDFVRSVAGGDPGDGTYVYVDVSDNGNGMDAVTAAHMFDPFFTTKAEGRGLGMASVLGIVRSHGGAIVVKSEPGCGTRIRVFFPAD